MKKLMSLFRSMGSRLPRGSRRGFVAQFFSAKICPVDGFNKGTGRPSRSGSLPVLPYLFSKHQRPSQEEVSRPAQAFLALLTRFVVDSPGFKRSTTNADQADTCFRSESIMLTIFAGGLARGTRSKRLRTRWTARLKNGRALFLSPPTTAQQLH